jgi:hypothetical protein
MRNIIEELDRLETVDKHLFVESKANHAIVAAINVIRLIKENFGNEEADELCRRLLNSIKGEDPRKFQRKIRQLKEEQE